jgi:putative membrane protein
MKQSKSYSWLIYTTSLAIPAVVTLLYFIPKNAEVASALNVLPAVNATLNGLTSLVLVAAFMAIRRKNIPLHRALMLTALTLSVLFLVSYVLYHATHASVTYGATDWTRPVYYFILITHIILAAAIVPLVLITFVRALNQTFDKHRKIARITLPLWLYVTITGVVVYLMISPYYPF